MILGLALLLAAEAVPPATPAPHNEIVVVGRSLDGLKDDLTACIARRCPAREDVIASVRYAEGLFRVARYQDSRRVLQQAIERDKSAGHADPFAVAALYEATTTVARHDGEQAVVADAVFARASLLRETQPPDNIDRLRAELDEADVIYEQAVRDRDGPPQGLAAYRQLATRAEAVGQQGIAAACRIREAQYQASIGQTDLVKRLLDEVIAQGDVVPAGYRLTAYAVKARLPHKTGDTSATDALRTALARLPQKAPVLIYAPPPPVVADKVDFNYYSSIDNVSRGGDFIGVRWADIGFTVRPDGTVADAEKLRGTLRGDLADAIAANIGRRRYSAATADEGDRYRIERWTLTADYGTPIGSLIRRRYIHPHFETLDVTSDPREARSRGTTS